MTGPNPGQGDEIPQPWGGRPPESRYGTGWDGGPTDPYYEDTGYQPPFGTPPRGPNRKVVVAIAAAVVVVVGAGVALWWFAVGPGKSGAQAVTVSSRPPSRPVAPPALSTGPPTSAAPDSAAAYDVGSCFDEVGSGQPGKVQLNPVPCAGASAVFVINSVVASSADCDTGQGAADYKDHGYEVPDETANVAYCASLVVPVNQCFMLGAAAPIARTSCGSQPNVVRVEAIESAPAAASACSDKTDPDVWFYQAPTSGQFACVSRPATTATPTAPATTTPG